MDTDFPSTRLDVGRAGRTGEPEVVYAEPKTPAQVASALRELRARTSGPVLATRATPAHAAAVPEARYDETSGLLVVRAESTRTALGRVAVVSAGTGDLPVAAEASGTLHAFGLTAEVIADVGVAGVHRVLEVADELDAADVVIVVAGMEAALPTVVAGLVSAPVVAVPTSVGYGASFQGLTALLSTLASCAPGVSVVNIDNGFGAAIVARRILRTRS